MLTSSDDMNDELLVSYLLGEASPDSTLKVERWIASTPAHRRYFDHLKMILEASRTIDIPETIQEDAAWQRFRERITQPAKIRRLNTTVKRLWIAAAALVVATTAVLYFGPTWPSAVKTYASRDVSKPETLPDGTIATLNKHSEIRYEHRNNTRKVTLKGEAFFAVAANKNEPFIVTVNDTRIIVLGTSFNIKNLNDVTEVVVETGSVRVDGKNKTVILSQGEKAEISAEDTAIRKEVSEDKLYNYYRTHEFVCVATPLWKLADVLSEAYGVRIIIENKELRNQPLTTTFSNEPLDDILNVIGQTFSITIERRGTEIILK